MSEITKPNFTQRGFANWPKISDGHGVTIRVAESSEAMGPYLWIFTEGHIGDEKQNGAAHLSLVQAAEFAECLIAAVQFMQKRFGLTA